MATTFTQLTSSTNQVLSSGYYYVAPNTVVNCTNLIVDSNNVTIYVPAGSTLNCKGDNASGTNGGRAGIRLTSGSLHLYGGGTIIALGGNAADGKDGTSGVANTTGNGTTGAGGAGGGGAGAGIGTDGGNGGAQVNSKVNSTAEIVAGDPAHQGSAVAVYSAKVYVAAGVTLSATGGAAGTYYGLGGASPKTNRTASTRGYYYNYACFGGGGGCPGKAGANIGLGGAGGPSGEGGGYYYKYAKGVIVAPAENMVGWPATESGSGKAGKWTLNMPEEKTALPYLTGGVAYDSLPLGFLWLDTLTATQQVLTPPQLVPNYVVTKLVGSGGSTATAIGLPLIAGFSPEVVWPSAPSGFLGFNEAPDGSGVYDFNASMGIENGGLFTGGAITSTSLADVTIYAICGASGPIVYINAGGSFVKGAPYVNVGGVWKQGKDVYTNVGGTWKKV